MKRLSTTETELQRVYSATRRGEDIDAHGLGVTVTEPPAATLDRFSRYERNGLVAAHQAEVEALRAHAVDLEAIIAKMKRREDYLMMALLAAVLITAYFAVRDLACPVVPWEL